MKKPEMHQNMAVFTPESYHNNNPKTKGPSKD